MKYQALLFVMLVMSPLLYFSYLVLKGWAEVRSAPRADMYICPKGHGPLQRSALINFMGEDFCPICFHQKLKAAEEGRPMP